MEKESPEKHLLHDGGDCYQHNCAQYVRSERVFSLRRRDEDVLSEEERLDELRLYEGERIEKNPNRTVGEQDERYHREQGLHERGSVGLAADHSRKRDAVALDDQPKPQRDGPINTIPEGRVTVRGTPTLFINGKKVTNRSVEGMSAMVDAALKEADKG